MYLLTGSTVEADDLAQEALVRVFERWDRVSGMERADGYLYRTALNLHRSSLRRAARWRRRLRPDPQADDPMAGADSRLEVQRALASLTRGQRDAVVLVDWVGLSDEEVGAILGLKPGSVRSRLHRGRNALKEVLGGEHD
jgi:RNA polymerase sigma-70 factor (ECF subfamily)